MKTPTFILSDETGRIQLALVTEGLSEAQSVAATFAKNRNRPVLIYSVTHIATYSPPVGDAAPVAVKG